MQDESLLGAVCSPVTSSTGIINMTDQQTLYEIRYSPLHGHGVFAKVDIKKNKSILKEAPLWSLKPEEGDKIRELAGSGDPPKLTKLGHYFTKLPGSSRTILTSSTASKESPAAKGAGYATIINSGLVSSRLKRMCLML